MLELFLFVIIPAAVLFYVFVYRGWSYKKKFVFKTVLIYMGLAMTALVVVVIVSTMGMVAEEVGGKQLPSRLESVNWAVENNNYENLQMYLIYDEDYEEEFEPYWERMIMYESCLRYRIYSAAEENGLGEEYDRQADYYETMLLEHCENPEYAENEPYAEYFMELVEIK